MEHLDKKEGADRVGDACEKVQRRVTGSNGTQPCISEQRAQPFTQTAPETDLSLWYGTHRRHTDASERICRDEKRTRVTQECQGCAHQLDEPPRQSWRSQVREQGTHFELAVAFVEL